MVVKIESLFVKS